MSTPTKTKSFPPVASAASNNNWQGKMGTWRESINDECGPTIDDDNVPIGMSLWLLIQNGSLVPQSFICPLSKQRADNAKGAHLWGFKPGTLSYSYQVPYGSSNEAISSTNLDARMAISADLSPYYDDRGKRIRTALAPPSAASTFTNQQWEPFNSPNHKHEGQNVLFADSHAEYSKKPSVGVGDGNIYTLQKGIPWAGQVPKGSDVPGMATDSVLAH